MQIYIRFLYTCRCEYRKKVGELRGDDVGTIWKKLNPSAPSENPDHHPPKQLSQQEMHLKIPISGFENVKF